MSKKILQTTSLISLTLLVAHVAVMPLEAMNPNDYRSDYPNGQRYTQHTKPSPSFSDVNEFEKRFDTLNDDARRPGGLLYNSPYPLKGNQGYSSYSPYPNNQGSSYPYNGPTGY